jgi:hypothetical protein
VGGSWRPEDPTSNPCGDSDACQQRELTRRWEVFFVEVALLAALAGDDGILTFAPEPRGTTAAARPASFYTFAPVLTPSPGGASMAIVGTF